MEVGQKYIMFRFVFFRPGPTGDGGPFRSLTRVTNAMKMLCYLAFQICSCFRLDHRSCWDTVIYVSWSAFCDNGQHVIVNSTAHSWSCKWAHSKALAKRVPRYISDTFNSCRTLPKTTKIPPNRVPDASTIALCSAALLHRFFLKIFSILYGRVICPGRRDVYNFLWSRQLWDRKTENKTVFPFVVLKPTQGSGCSRSVSAAAKKTCFSHIALRRCRESSPHKTRVTTELGERMLH